MPIAALVYLILLALPQISIQFRPLSSPSPRHHRRHQTHTSNIDTLENSPIYPQPQQRYKCTVSYDGTYFSGWQVQRNSKHRTVAGTLEEVLCSFISHKLDPALDPDNFYVLGSSRTDSGVHARGQVCHFTLPSPCDPAVALPEINLLLPRDLRVLTMEPVEGDFHAIRSSTAKLYCYRMSISDVPQSPFKRLYRTQVQRGVDLKVLEEAVKIFQGTHDFRAFAGQVEQVGGAAPPPTARVPD